MTDPNSPLFWFEYWQQQNAIFMKLYQDNITLFQNVLDLDKWPTDFNRWVDSLKALLEQNQNTFLATLSTSWIQQHGDHKQRNLWESFILKLFEQTNHTIEIFRDTVLQQLKTTKGQKNIPNAYELWLSSYKSSWEQMFNNPEYQRLFGGLFQSFTNPWKDAK